LRPISYFVCLPQNFVAPEVFVSASLSAMAAMKKAMKKAAPMKAMKAMKKAMKKAAHAEDAPAMKAMKAMKAKK